MIFGSAIHYPKLKETEYRKVLSQLDRSVKKRIRNNIINNLSTLLDERGEFFSMDDELDDIDRALEKVRKDSQADVKATKTRMLRVAISTSGAVVQNLQRSTKDLELASQFSQLTTKQRSLNRLIKSWATTNAEFITTIPNNLLTDVAVVIRNGFVRGNTLEYIRKQIQTKFNVSKNRAKFIARDQIAKLNTNITRHEQGSIGLDFYRFSTSRDDRVRENHAKMDDKICSWNDSTIYKDSIRDKRWKKRSSIGGVELAPGEDFNCRCSIIPILIPE